MVAAPEGATDVAAPEGLAVVAPEAAAPEAPTAVAAPACVDASTPTAVGAPEFDGAAFDPQAPRMRVAAPSSATAFDVRTRISTLPMPPRSATSIAPCRGAWQHGVAVTQPHDGTVITALVGYAGSDEGPLGPSFLSCRDATIRSRRRRSARPFAEPDRSRSGSCARAPRFRCRSDPTSGGSP